MSKQVRFSACVLLLGGVARSQCAPEEVAGLTAPGNAALEVFASSVATSGEVTLIGSPGWGFAGMGDCGAAFVYRRDPVNAHAWTLSRVLTAPPGNTLFGRTVVLDGDVAVIACKDTSAPGLFVAHVLERNAGGVDTWGRVATLHNDDYPAGSGDDLGRAIAVDSDTIAVAGPYFGFPWVGAVYVFGRDIGGPGAWGKIKRIDRLGGPGPGTTQTDFGFSLNLVGDTLMVHDRRGGLAHLFQCHLGGANQWGLAHTFSAVTPPAFYARVVQSVALRDDEAWIGWRLRRIRARRLEPRPGKQPQRHRRVIRCRSNGVGAGLGSRPAIDA